MKQQVILGDCLEVMKTFPNNHFNCVLTDPPYGLKFMSKKWDYDIPGIEYWKELLRICKPGTMMLCFGGTRTHHRLTCTIEDAGWEIRDCLQWIFASGFPKSHNHFGFEGYGTALKPAYETILLCMKPLDGTFAQNAEKWGVAGINIDSSRVGESQHEKDPSANQDREKWRMNNGAEPKKCKDRWPANILFDEEAAEMLDEQSGILQSGKLRANIETESKNQVYGKREKANINPYESNMGYASRFFYCAKASSRERNEGLEGMPLKQEIGGGGINHPKAQAYGSIKPLRSNSHPTIKPIKLLKYLLKLIAPPKDVLVLDPFLGSGSTLIAAKELGISGIGIEKEKEYHEIAVKRIENWEIKEEQIEMDFD